MSENCANDPFLLGMNPAPESVDYDTQSMLNKVGQNTGNLIFTYAISKHLGCRAKQVSRHSNPDDFNQYGNLAVLPCANHLGCHDDFGYLVEKFSKAKVAMVAIGLGAQQSIGEDLPDVPRGTIQWIQEIINKAPSTAPNISVRGSFTLKVLEKYGLDKYAVVTGCPSLFISGDRKLGKRISRKLINRPERIAVVSGDIRIKNLSNIERSLAKLVANTNGAYILQSSLDLMKICRSESDRNVDLSTFRKYIFPEYTGKQFYEWVRNFGHVFYNVPAWMEFYKKFDLVVGTRFHGVSLAIQAGIPALCIVHDSRTLELCKLMKIPYVLASEFMDGLTLSEIHEYSRFDWEEFDKNRIILATCYSEFLKINSISEKLPLLK